MNPQDLNASGSDGSQCPTAERSSNSTNTRGTNHNPTKKKSNMAETEECEDECFSRFPRLVKLDQNKKLMPVEELKALAKKMFDQEKQGDKSYLENFLSDVMTMAQKNQRSSLSLQDAKSNIQYFLQRNGVVPRPEITGIETEAPLQVQSAVLQAA